ncbi:class I lanthipeptide [Chryseobacterium pennipullorum]|nr:class I lanthipeptide [Chryseobacterium pennipullorum]
MRTKKLTLKKSVVANLDKKAMGQVKGGLKKPDMGLTPETFGCGETSAEDKGCGSDLCQEFGLG